MATAPGTHARTLDTAIEKFRLREPLRISGYTFTEVDVLLVTVRDGNAVGRGEASGIYYLGETPVRMRDTVESHRNAVEAGLSRRELQSLLVAGGARNALDCALWELEAQQRHCQVWNLAGVASPRPLVTTFTLSADAPRLMAAQALRLAHARALKLKLTGDVTDDARRVRAVRDARPDVWLAVDANQGYTPDTWSRVLPAFFDTRVSLIEQPFARGRDADLDGLKRPIPIVADESALSACDIESLVGRFDVVNIKLDKSGGLTEALRMASEARRHGLKVMVGSMVGSSWAIAPAFVLGQFCDIIDLDGPLFLETDRVPGVRYADGLVHCWDDVWGGATT